ncbi:hypothetical protein HK104_003668 [Borealophlyctis nickersoniae]|nr:hypothetical protein HK104_003668 [Borealophlyctis nickersoniae]
MPNARVSDHPTTAVRLLDDGTVDFGDIWHMAYHMTGFHRLWLRPNNHGGTVVQFNSVKEASAGLQAFKRAGHFDVQYIYPPSFETEPVQASEPSPALYIRLMKGMTETAMTKILKNLRGLDCLKFGDNNVKVFFNSVESATRASEKLYQTTNIFSFYWHPHTDDGGYSPSNHSSTGPLSSRTLHVSKLDRDLADLRAYFYRFEDPPTRIGFHRGYIFVVFETAEAANRALARVRADTSTTMAARKVEMDYAPHFVPCPVGKPLRTIMLSYLTIAPTKEEMTRFFSGYSGFVSLTQGKKACFATFETEADATTALEDLNGATNLKAVYRTPEYSKDGVLKAGPFTPEKKPDPSAHRKQLPPSPPPVVNTPTPNSGTRTRLVTAERAASILKSMKKPDLIEANPFDVLEDHNNDEKDDEHKDEAADRSMDSHNGTSAKRPLKPPSTPTYALAAESGCCQGGNSDGRNARARRRERRAGLGSGEGTH